MSLVKMTVLAFDSSGVDMLTKPPQVYFAMFNPSSYKIEYQIKYQEQTSNGNVPSVSEGTDAAAAGLSSAATLGGAPTTPTASTGSPSGEEPRKMAFDFLIDGTGASGVKRNVYLDVEMFKRTVGYKKGLNPTSQDTGNLLPFLLLIWGTFIFQCKIEAISVNFTLFDTFGIPLRATMSCTFREVPGVLGAMGNPLEAALNSTQFASAANVANLLVGAANLSASVVNTAKEMDLDSIRQPI